MKSDEVLYEERGMSEELQSAFWAYVFPLGRADLSFGQFSAMLTLYVNNDDSGLDAIIAMVRGELQPLTELNAREPIRRGFSDWFVTRVYDGNGVLTEESWSRPRTLSALLSLALVLYAFAPFFAPFIGPLKTAMKDFAWLVAEMKLAILGGALGLEFVRAIKGGAFMRPLSSGPVRSPLSSAPLAGGPEK